jgi:hypothetical protein
LQEPSYCMGLWFRCVGVCLLSPALGFC